MQSPNPCITGRGALSNEFSRFDSERRIRTTDGWETEASAEPAEDDELAAPAHDADARCDAHHHRAQQLARHAFDRSINPYRGCEHGCIYCFARPTHAYLGLSPGLDFETKLFFKPDAAELLAASCRARLPARRRSRIGTNTDPYQPLERELRITRAILEVLARLPPSGRHHHQVALVLRDLDILAAWPSAPGRVVLSVTTLDRELARAMEPRAARPHERLDAIRALAAAGVPVGVMIAPMIPGLNDHEMEAILEAAAEAGAHARGLRRPAPAARDQGAVQRMAGAHHPTAPARDVAGPPDARRQALRRRLRRAHEGRGPGRRAAGAALRRRRKAPRPEPGSATGSIRSASGSPSWPAPPLSTPGATRGR